MITTFFPFDPNPGRLKRLAREHAQQLDLEHGGDSSQVPLARLIVNYLHHECTDYDLEQSGPRHRAACEAIAQRFPWLAEECQRQITRRAQQDVEAEWHLRTFTAEREHHRAEHRTMVARSREVIKEMRVGQRVGFRLGGHRRTGVITKLGRSRVTVAYQVATGRERDRVRLFHAALLTPVEENPKPFPAPRSGSETHGPRCIGPRRPRPRVPHRQRGRRGGARRLGAHPRHPRRARGAYRLPELTATGHACEGEGAPLVKSSVCSTVSRSS